MTFTRSLLVRGGIFGMLISILLAGSASAAGPSEYLIYSFPRQVEFNAVAGNLVADGAGNLYGTTYWGGTSGLGAVIELLRPVPPNTKWTIATLYSFTGIKDGQFPQGGMIFDKAGNLYGTTTQNGETSDGGTVFKLTAPATEGGEWIESVLYNFQGGISDGATPRAGVVFDSSGNLYGTTASGGVQSARGAPRAGTVFQLTPPATPGGAWTETVIHFFKRVLEGGMPVSTPILDAKGNLYGTTSYGGENGGGAAWRLTPPSGSGAWTYRQLCALPGQQYVDQPTSSLTLRGNGVLYGTDSSGGQYGLGMVYQLVPPSVAGGAWTENILHSFAGGINDGALPEAAVIFDAAGNLYSTTSLGGSGLPQVDCSLSSGCGTVFKLTPPSTAGGSWTETILHGFPSNENDGFAVLGGVVLGKNGVLFGVTVAGGIGAGTVFAVVR
jgi:uncharacterized repeat protein (TIGR03803 family)